MCVRFKLISGKIEEIGSSLNFQHLTSKRENSSIWATAYITERLDASFFIIYLQKLVLNNNEDYETTVKFICLRELDIERISRKY